MSNGTPQVTRANAYNWDGSFYYKEAIQSTVERKNWKELLKSAVKQSLEPVTDRSDLGEIAEKVTLTQDHIYTIFDELAYGEEDYESEWTHIDVELKSGTEKILSFRRLATKQEGCNPISEYPVALTFLKELDAFCGVMKPNDESERETESAKEFEKVEEQEYDVGDTDDLEGDYHAFNALILHHLVDEGATDVPEERNVENTYVY